VSADGRLASTTVFVSGHSYAPGSFSTHTAIFRTADGGKVADLEQYSVERDGKPFSAVDFNFWGVTFASDGKHFYATLASGGQNYLVEGDMETQHARIIHSGVECPSLAPDGRRLAFKRMTRSGWHIYVLDLASGKETPLAEQHSVDDQVEWLDNDRVLYALDSDIRVMSADGSGTPAIFLADAYSPAVVR
jgi:Tol biopolymer transport system component